MRCRDGRDDFALDDTDFLDDYWEQGYGRIIMVPRVKLAYDKVSPSQTPILPIFRLSNPPPSPAHPILILASLPSSPYIDSGDYKKKKKEQRKRKEERKKVQEERANP
jgi:hypothetical protein